MSVPMAYIGVILIWSTTPIAVLWSSEEVGFIFGMTSRMVFGAVFATMAVALLGAGLTWNRKAMQLYLISGLTFFFAMFLIYWAVQFIPTGWVSLLYGFMPIATALMARVWLQSETLSTHRMFGMALGFVGLATIFSTAISLSPNSALGISAILLAVILHAGSSVWIKRQQTAMPAIVMTSGGLLVAAPLFLLVWFVNGSGLPLHTSDKTLWSIAYLALFGSVFGFALYYYVLKNIDATKTSLITLIAPVLALALGHMLNGEPLTSEIIAGAILILGGLMLFELGHRIPIFMRKSQ